MPAFDTSLCQSHKDCGPPLNLINNGQVANEPVADIMASVHDGHVQMLLEQGGIEEAAVPVVEYIGDPLATSAAPLPPMNCLKTVDTAADGGEIKGFIMPYEGAGDLPDVTSWFVYLGSLHPGCWLRAAVLTEHVVQVGTLL